MAKQKELKTFLVTYRSRYFPYEGSHTKLVMDYSAANVRRNWHSIIHTDEYVIKKCEEVKDR